ncbi:MAG: hypothetical protein COU06_02165 [Candidatus Harrisonbacteria bacterium CG10_big_fil_rev_8_21_14_0_10_38_8]|uniref:Phosphatidic acid phosphatase type 2/haloperoxidase domain-containing protein n=1 Tax=Candidatus Harrisonbacteria bacterium CG10_big_fil_rev_8_21_14_0_10_38_8 TaxID=1974582 RepID=A0A2M6WJS9_9BACT|nr:MAG: hypothetical protein COU06_02165 [Candidatus Harrisonbacteria bacterium CG10_big_fil_rev_8_21_14_0_10_38_8]
MNQLVGTTPILDFLSIVFATYVPYLVGIFFVFLIILTKGKWKRVELFLITLLSFIFAHGVVIKILNYFFYQERPFVANNFIPLVFHVETSSFPSGHATFFFLIAVITYLFINKKFSYWMLALAVLISLARVYAGVHYLMDIFVGSLLGAVTPFIILWILPSSVKEFFKKEND